jgi:CPA1 family monovalent cation:H+ antiporter
MCSRKIREKERKPGSAAVFVEGWSGMRGVVSLAAALALPLTLSTGERFPHRNLILFITFTVILFTIVIQGLSLPWVIRWLHIQNDDDDRKPETALRLRLATAVLAHIQADYGHEAGTIDAFIRLRQRYERMAKIAEQRLDQGETPAFLPRYRQLLLELVGIQRNELVNLRRDDTFPEELLRSKELELDLEEARFRN